jgi:tetratricopeptide (TPR) repeat protein
LIQSTSVESQFQTLAVITLEIQLATQPGSVALLFQRGNLLQQLGRTAEARCTWLELLGHEPSHLRALSNLGNLLFAAGENTEARRIYSEAVARHPDDSMSRVNFAKLLIKDGELEEAHKHLEHALKVDPNYRAAHAGMAFVLKELGNPEKASWHGRTAFQGRCVVPVPYRGEGSPITILELVSQSRGNIRAKALLSDRVFQKYLVATEFYDSTTPLPPHHLVFNAIGDADVASAALAGAQSLAAHSTAPVINSPTAVLATGRCAIARRLSGITDLVAPKTVILPRELLVISTDVQTTLTFHGLEFPLLLRTPGFHGGEHFLRVETLDELRAAAAKLPGRDLLLIQYLDARASDGKARKYRVMMIDGHLYPLHVAISSHWKVHYFSAEMTDYPAHRAEDAEFLANMSGVLGSPAMAALKEIQATLGLDYGGIDFGLSETGEVLLFEANATMAVLPPDPDTRWDYRRPAVERICKAVREMLMDRAKAAG